MKCTKCNSRMWLYFSGTEKPDGSFFWKCSNYINCQEMQPYIPLHPEINFVEGSFSEILKNLTTKSYSEQEVIVTEIKSQMVKILKHFIGCTWGAHYMTLYYELIHPYLDNKYVLDFVLKGDSVLNRDNVIIGISGSKIYPELADLMSKVNSKNIKDYMSNEFPFYNPRSL